jgi:hypothetical protein
MVRIGCIASDVRMEVYEVNEFKVEIVELCDGYEHW